MSYIGSTEYFTEVAKGNVAGATRLHKFGWYDTIGTSFTPICGGGIYPTPTTASTLEAISTSTNDTAAGSGARKILVQGLDGNFDEVEEEITMNGTSASTATTASFIRVFRAYVTESGTYANATSPSQDGTITIRISSAGANQMVLPEVDTNFGSAQSLTTAYTIPAGKTGYLLCLTAWVDSTKPADIVFFQRPNADDVATPFSGAMRIVAQFTGVANSAAQAPYLPIGVFSEKTDVGMMAKVGTGTGTVSADFQLLLVDN